MLDLVRKIGWFPCGKDPSLIERFLTAPAKEAPLGVFAKGYFRLYVYSENLYCFYADVKEKSWSLVQVSLKYNPSCHYAVVEEQLGIFQKLTNLAFEMKESFNLDDAINSFFTRGSDNRDRKSLMFRTYKVYFEEDVEFESTLAVKKACSPLGINVIEDLEGHSLNIPIPNNPTLCFPISEDGSGYTDLIKVAQDTQLLATYLKHLNRNLQSTLLHSAFARQKSIWTFKMSLLEVLLSNLVRWKFLTEKEKASNLDKAKYDLYDINFSFSMVSSANQLLVTQIDYYSVQGDNIRDFSFSFTFCHDMLDILNEKYIEGLDKVLQSKKTYHKRPNRMFISSEEIAKIALDIFPIGYGYLHVDMYIVQKVKSKEPKITLNAPINGWTFTSNTGDTVSSSNSFSNVTTPYPPILRGYR